MAFESISYLNPRTNTPTAAPGAVLIRSLNADALSLRPFTVVRNRGMVMVFSDQEANSELQEGAYGEIVVSDQAVAAGVASIPTPVTEDSSDWHVYQRFMSAYAVVSAVGVFVRGFRYDIDSKAMRKVDLGEDLIAVVESSSISAGLKVISYTRNLIKLH